MSNFTPRPWQVPMIKHILENERCALFCAMGMGKTSAVLTALTALQMSGEDHPTLVLAPLRVACTTWPEEVRKWDHLRGVDVMPIAGNEAQRRAALRYDAAIYTCNYEQLEWLVNYYGDRWPFKTVIADEMSKLKSFRLRQGGRRAAALAKVAHRQVRRFIGLTGTPASNGLQDLWGSVWFVDQGKRLGRTFAAFKERWFQKSFNGYGSAALPHAQEQIQSALRDVCLTVDLKDYVSIAEPVVNNIYVDLPPNARRLYRDMEKQMFMELEGAEVEAFNAAARTIKCLQIASGAAITGEGGEWKHVHDAKLDALEDIVEEANGAPILCAYHFKSDLARLKKAFPKGRELDKNPETIKDWNKGKIPILFAHPASAGHGLNLQDGGNILVYFSHWWNLEERMQILERIGPTRQMQAGHDRACYVYNIIAKDTVDEDVIERVETKREIQDILLASMKRKRIGYAA